MALDLNEIIAYSQGIANDMAPTKAETKRDNLFSSTRQKEIDVYGEPKSTMIQSIPDGDGFVPVGGSENRAKGFDAYEINHPELNNDSAFLKHKQREKQRFSEQYGIPLDQVTDQMTQEKAEEEKLNFLYNTVKQPGDAPWTPGPINNPNEPLILGSEENPLNIPANTQVTGQDKYKRDISNVYNPNTGQLVNEAMQSGFNALNFDGKYPNQMKMMNKNQQVQDRQNEMNQDFEVGEVVKGNISKLDRDVDVKADGSFDSIKPITVKDENGYDTIIPSVINGKEVSRKEAIAHHKKTGEHLGKYTSERATENALEKIANTGYIDTLRRKDPATLTSKERGTLLNERLKGLETSRDNSYWGQAGDVAQSSLAQTGAGIIDSVADTANKIFGDGSNTNIAIPGFDKSVEEYKDKEAMDKEFGANKYQAEKMHADIQELKDKADKDPSFMNVAKYIAKGAVSTPQIFAESAGEIATYIHPVGWGLQILNRTNNDAETFAQNNGGEKMSGEQATLSFATNTAAYMLDKVMGKIAIKTGVKGLSAPFKGKLKKEITEGTLMAMGGAAGEGIQEYIDQVQQIFNTEKLTGEDALERLKRIGSSKEAIDAAALGAVAGGTTAIASKAMPLAAKGSKAALKANSERIKNNAEIEVGEYTTKEDIDFIRTNLEVDLDASKETMEAQDHTRKSIEASNSFEELEASGNKEARKFAEEFRKNATKKVEFGSKEHKAEITSQIMKMVDKDADMAHTIFEKRGLDLKGKTKEEIAEQINNLPPQTLKDMEEANSGAGGSSFKVETASKAEMKKLLNEKFTEFKDASLQVLDMNKESMKLKTDALSKTNANFEKGVVKRGEEKSGTIDIDKTGKINDKGFLKSFIDTATFQGNKALLEMNKYSNDSLEVAKTELEARIKNGEGKEVRKFEKLKKQIDKIQDRRKDVKESGQLDTKTKKQVRNLGELKGNKPALRRHLTDALLQKSMNDLRDVRATEELIKSAEEQGVLSKEQAKKYRTRLDKISKEAVEPDDKTLAEEAKNKAKYQAEKGLSDIEMENEKKNELSEKDIDDNLEAIQQEHLDVDKEIEAHNEAVGDKTDEELSPEEIKKTEELNKKQNNIIERMNKNLSNKYQFTQADMELNNEHGKMNEFFEGSETFDIKDAFTKAEREILNIC